SRATGNDLERRASTPATTPHQVIRVSGAIYGQIKSGPVEVRIEYSFTLFRATRTYALPARDGDQRMPAIGWCATRINDAGTHVLFRCLKPGERASCVAVVLEHAP